MEETKITAKLPSLDVEITRRELPEQNAETITLRMTAVPSFDAVFGSLTKPGNLPLLPFDPDSPINPWPMNPWLLNPWLGGWSAPMAAWSRWAEIAWAPWLEAMSPLVTLTHQDENESPQE